MLEVSSSRIDLSPSANLLTSYFLELYGETSPVVDPDYARVLAARGKATAGPIYEYFWTLGRYEPPPQDDAQQQDPRESRKASASGGRHWRFPHSHRTGDADGWGEFTTDSSAQVRLLFPRNSGWRAHELAVSVKYLAPVPQQKSFLEEMGKDIAALQPLLGVAGTVAGAAGEVGAGPVASATGQVLDAVAKMKVDSVPQAPGFEWSVEKITTWVERKPEDRMLPGGGQGTRRRCRVEPSTEDVRGAGEPDQWKYRGQPGAAVEPGSSTDEKRSPAARYCACVRCSSPASQTRAPSRRRLHLSAGGSG